MTANTTSTPTATRQRRTSLPTSRTKAQGRSNNANFNLLPGALSTAFLRRDAIRHQGQAEVVPTMRIQRQAARSAEREGSRVTAEQRGVGLRHSRTQSVSCGVRREGLGRLARIRSRTSVMFSFGQQESVGDYWPADSRENEIRIRRTSVPILAGTRFLTQEAVWRTLIGARC